MAAGGDSEARITADYNAEMIEHIARYPRLRDRAIFVGDPDDIVPHSFDPDLPRIRDWTQQHTTSPATSPASTRASSATAKRSFTARTSGSA